MYREKDFEVEEGVAVDHVSISQDLNLEALFEAMADGDGLLVESARQGLLVSLREPAEILYRQDVLRDCIDQQALALEIYAIAVEAMEAERKVYRGFLDYPDSILRRAIGLLQLFLGLLKRLRNVADTHAEEFRSDGFRSLFGRIQGELDDEYLHSVENHLRFLEFRQGVLLSARLDSGNKGVGYVVRRPASSDPIWKSWLSFMDRSRLTIVIADRDDNGARALADLRARGINIVANAAAQSAEHILSFFKLLRFELGFYVACLNLRRRLVEKGEPVCFPTSSEPDQPALSFQGLYEPVLSLKLATRAVGNDGEADGKRLLMITGANQGGKSTFLRSLGLAQLMMQSGMFVAANRLNGNTCDGVYSHFKRKEDPSMTSGKLDDELKRMSEIVPSLKPSSLLLLNESFASTNEREGSEIATGIVTALLEADVKVCYVTHSFDLADSLYDTGDAAMLFLQAERQPDGTRTFKVVEASPSPISFGEDLHQRIFEPTASGGS